MSFLKKYKTQFDDAKKKYMPDEKAHDQNAAYAEHATQSHQHGEPSQQPYQQPSGQQHQQPDQQPYQQPHDQQYQQQNQAQNPQQNHEQQHHNQAPAVPVADHDAKPKKNKNAMLMGAGGGLAGGMLGKWAMKKAGRSYRARYPYR
ncbi:MAG: hypothetical protein Q9168_002875 [Polycauliona sp. 1 TL-2023]